MVVVLSKRILVTVVGSVVVEEVDLVFARAKESRHCVKDLRNSMERKLASEEVWIVMAGNRNFLSLCWE